MLQTDRFIGKINIKSNFKQNNEERYSQIYISRLLPKGAYYSGKIHEQVMSKLPRVELQVSELEGALIEIGVWKGGTGGLIAKKSELCGIEDSVYLCDTFSGVVKANPIHDNVYRGGEHSDTNEKLVKDLVYDQLQLNNVKVLKGIFPNDTEFLVEDQLFRFCHIDVDVYNSAKDIFEWVWDRMIIGGIVVFDDYGFITCQGVTKYVNELRENKDNIFIHNLNGHGVFIKIK